jgi:hypothetical protein
MAELTTKQHKQAQILGESILETEAKLLKINAMIREKALKINKVLNLRNLTGLQDVIGNAEDQTRETNEQIHAEIVSR